MIFLWYIVNFIYILLDLIRYLIYIDMVLSFLTLFWLNLRPQILRDLLDPIYLQIKKRINTIIWPFELAPLIVLFAIYTIKVLVSILFSVIINSNI